MKRLVIVFAIAAFLALTQGCATAPKFQPGDARVINEKGELSGWKTVELKLGSCTRQIYIRPDSSVAGTSAAGECKE